MISFCRRLFALGSLVLVAGVATLIADRGAVSGEQNALPVGSAFEAADAAQLLGGDAVPDIVVSPGSGGVATHIFDGATGALLGSGFPFGPTFASSVRMAAGDLSGDGVADVVMATGPGGGLVTLLNGATILPIGSGYPFGAGYFGGISVAVADIDGDGFNDIITGQSSGGGTVAAFSGRSYGPLLAITPFGPAYAGGVNVAAGDFDGDGRADLVVGQATGGSVALVNTATRAVGIAAPYGAVNGVFTATADVNGDGRAEAIAAPGSGGGPLLVFDVHASSLISAFTPYPGFAGGVRIAATDVTGDGRADIVTVPGPGRAPTVRIFDGRTFGIVREFLGLPAPYSDGAYVAAPATLLRFATAAQGTMLVGTAATLPVRAPGAATLTVSGALPGGVTFSHSGAGNGVLSGTPAAATGGVYPLVFTAVVGSTTLTQNYALTIQQPPSITSAATAALNVGTAANFQITTSGYPRATISMTGTLPAGVTFTANANGTAMLAGTPAVGSGGNYPVTVTATNGIGTAASQALLVVVQTQPSVTSPSAATFTEGSSGSFTVTSTGAPPVTSMTSVGALPAGVTFVDNGNGTATLAGTPTPGTGGTYPLTFTASNGIELGSQSFVLTVRRPAAITSGNTTTFVAGTPGAFMVTTTGLPAPTVSVTGALPAGVTFLDNGDGTASIAGTAAAGASGPYPVTISASNGVGAPAAQAFVLTVNAAPGFTSVATATFDVGTAGSFTVTATGWPRPSLTSTGVLPTGVTFQDNGNGTASLAGTPAPGTGGSYVLALTAANGIGAPTVQSFTLVVHQPPVITSGTGASFQLGVAGSFTVTTTGSPTSTLSMTGAVPTGVTFTPNGNGTGTLAGTPAAGSQGSYPLVFTASNGVGAAATQNFLLSVTCPTVVLSPAGGALTAGTYGAAYSQVLGATGGSGHTFTVTAGSLPGGLVLASNGTLSGTLTNTGTFNFTVTATAASGCSGAASYSISATPNAQNETFSNGVGNTQFVVGAGLPATPAVSMGGTVLSNDAGAGSLTAGPASIASTYGGQVVMNTNGTFIYTPQVGFAGPSDTFTYTLTDGNGQVDTAVVTINLSGVVWYVNSGGSNGDGRAHAPFNSMPAAASAAQASHIIYVHPGTPAGSTVLKAGQRLQGAGETFTFNGLTIPAGAAPTLQSTIALANNVDIRALNVNTPSDGLTGAGLTGVETLTNVGITAGANGLSLTNVGGTFSTVGGAIAGGASGASVAIDGGGGAIAIGSSVSAAAGRSVSVQNKTGGAVTFSGAVSDTAAGIRLLNNTGSSVAFTGGLALSTGANTAFSATGGGTVVATQNNVGIVNTIQTTSGTALEVTNTEIGGAGLTFRSIAAGTTVPSSGLAVSLVNTGVAAGNGGLTVTGTGTAGSGGRILRKTGADGLLTEGHAYVLVGTKEPSLNWVQLDELSNTAVVGQNVLGLTITNSSMAGAGTTAGINEGSLIFGTAGSGGINGVTGSVVLTNVVVTGSVEHAAAFYQHSAALNLQVSGSDREACQFSSNSTTTGGHGLIVQTDGTATSTVSMSTCRIRDSRQSGLVALANETSALSLTVANSEFVRVSQGVRGLVAQNSGDAQMTVAISGSDFYDFDESAIVVGQPAGSGSSASLFRGTISGINVQHKVAATGSGVVFALSSAPGQSARSRLLFNGNSVFANNVLPAVAIVATGGASAPLVDATVTGNHLDMTDNVNGPIGLRLMSTGAGASLCGNVYSNTSHWYPTSVGAGGGIEILQSAAASFSLERGVEPLATAPGTVLLSNNASGPSGPSTASAIGSFLIVENGTCAAP